MPSKRRVILSGTPIQNDLQEFFVVMDIVNPGVLGTLTSFKRIYEKPIIQSRERNCAPKVREEGDARAKYLAQTCNNFILRRTSDILVPYLPPKVEQVLFCKLSPEQVTFYEFFLKSRKFMSSMSESFSFALGCIQLMVKLCNHPELVYSKFKTDFPEGLALYGEDYKPGTCAVNLSGKFQVVDRLLKMIYTEKSSKVVVVSNYTKTLDLLEDLCRQRGYSFLRLDGKTDSAKRMQLVDRFNSKFGKEFVFLLSSKAGGVGLNLIGGNRLIMFDPDWNPASDEQAMARVWREGQPKPVWIYRLICTGTIEEKIYQRQMRKQALSRSIVDNSFTEQRHFNTDELKQLFELNLETDCETHELIGCECIKRRPSRLSKLRKRATDVVGFTQGDGWQHFIDLAKCYDPLLQALSNELETPKLEEEAEETEDLSTSSLISFLFCHKTKDLNDIPVVNEPEVDETKDSANHGYESDEFESKTKKATKSNKPKPKTKVEIKIEEAEEAEEEAEEQEEQEEKLDLKRKETNKTKKVELLLDEEDQELAELLAL